MLKQDAIQHFGSAGKLAAALGISRAAVSQWKERVPPRRALEIEKLTGGQLKAPDLASQGQGVA